MENGTRVKAKSLELTPYINTSKEFTVINNKPYKEYDGWVEIANAEESIITRVSLLEETE